MQCERSERENSQNVELTRWILIGVARNFDWGTIKNIITGFFKWKKKLNIKLRRIGGGGGLGHGLRAPPGYANVGYRAWKYPFKSLRSPCTEAGNIRSKLARFDRSNIPKYKFLQKRPISACTSPVQQFYCVENVIYPVFDLKNSVQGRIETARLLQKII